MLSSTISDGGGATWSPYWITPLVGLVGMFALARYDVRHFGDDKVTIRDIYKLADSELSAC